MRTALAAQRSAQMWRPRRSLRLSSRYSAPSASHRSRDPLAASLSSAGARHNVTSFESLCHTFRAVERVRSSRVTSARILAHGYRQLLSLPTAQELASALYLTASQLAPPYEGVELQFGTKSFVKMLKPLEAPLEEQEADSTQTLEQVLASFPDYGLAVHALLDNGRVALPAVKEMDSELRIQAVHAELMAMAQDEGAGKVARQQQRALKLLQQCRLAIQAFKQAVLSRADDA